MFEVLILIFVFIGLYVRWVKIQEHKKTTGTETCLTEHFASYYRNMLLDAIVLNLSTDRLYFTDGDDEETIMLKDIVKVEKTNIYWVYPIGIKIISKNNTIDVFTVPIHKRNKWISEINRRVNLSKNIETSNSISSDNNNANNNDTNIKIENEPDLKHLLKKSGRKMDI